VQVQRLVLAGGLAWSVWRAWKTAWRDTFALLAAGATIGFFLRLITSGAISADRYQEGSIYDLAWIVPYLCYLSAALMAPASRPDASGVLARSGRHTVVVAAVPVPVVGNGDILFPQDVENARARSGCAGVMSARGVLIKPWLFREVNEGYRDLTADERVAIYRRYVTLARDLLTVPVRD